MDVIQYEKTLHVHVAVIHNYCMCFKHNISNSQGVLKHDWMSEQIICRTNYILELQPYRWYNQLIPHVFKIYFKTKIYLLSMCFYYVFVLLLNATCSMWRQNDEQWNLCNILRLESLLNSSRPIEVEISTAMIQSLFLICFTIINFSWKQISIRYFLRIISNLSTYSILYFKVRILSYMYSILNTELYSYGSSVGDNSLPRQNDIYQEIPLTNGVPFFDKLYNKAFVSEDYSGRSTKRQR